MKPLSLTGREGGKNEDKSEDLPDTTGFKAFGKKQRNSYCSGLSSISCEIHQLK